MNQIRNICAEGEIAFFTGSCFRSVDADKRFPADRAEVEKDPLTLPFFRQDETPGIDHFPAVFHLQVQTGKQAFRTEGNPDHCFGSAMSKIPFPVQTQPVPPDHLRPRVGIPGNTTQGFSGGCIQFLHENPPCGIYLFVCCFIILSRVSEEEKEKQAGRRRENTAGIVHGSRGFDV